MHAAATCPCWPRNYETPGEDPLLTGEFAAAFVRGFQESPVDPSHLQASACCKHYDANSMERSTEAGVSHTRHDFDANVTMQDLVDSYMPGFQACVEQGRVSGLMCR
jgi:beta-D-xylosidase 4